MILHTNLHVLPYGINPVHATIPKSEHSALCLITTTSTRPIALRAYTEPPGRKSCQYCHSWGKSGTKLTTTGSAMNSYPIFAKHNITL
uniref:Ovule protein n=1 Tax=Panagrellus redivivus TaxID=6233 RepID=A0A7E4V6H0_PANRE